MSDWIGEKINQALGLGPSGEFPDGKIHESDEGGLRIGVTTRQGNIILAFGARTAWIGLSPDEALQLANNLAVRARNELALKRWNELVKAAGEGKPRRTVAVDLDGVLSHYEGWKGFDHYGEPRPGAKQFMEDLRRIARVTVFTTRAKADFADRPEGTTPESAAAKVREWLDRHSIPYDEVYNGQGKPIASAYVDDRAVSVKSNPEPKDFAAAIDAVVLLL